MNPFINAHDVSDEQLMEKYQAGEYLAFEALYHRHQSTVYTYLFKRLQNPENRSEVFQNIFLKFHRTKEQYNSKYAFLKWLYTISRSELYDFCKKKKLSTVELDEGIHVQESQDEDNEIDLSTIPSLTTKEREAISLRYYSDLDFVEISERLNTSQSNARKLISRGIKKIKAKFNEKRRD